jgi:hypothetical protein
LEGRISMLPGIRILRFDTERGVVAIRYKVSANVWCLHFLPYDEFRVLMDDDVAFPV